MVRHLNQILSETDSNRSQPRSGSDTLDEYCLECGQGVLNSFILSVELNILDVFMPRSDRGVFNVEF